MDPMRLTLAHAVGFPDYPASLVADPYLNYIYNQKISSMTLENYVTLFVTITQHFCSDTTAGEAKDGDPWARPRPVSIRSLMNGLITARNNAKNNATSADTGSTKCREHVGYPVRYILGEDVESTVLYILGVWTTMLSSFAFSSNEKPQIQAAYEYQAEHQAQNPRGNIYPARTALTYR
jgi:hypothetical protein